MSSLGHTNTYHHQGINTSLNIIQISYQSGTVQSFRAQSQQCRGLSIVLHQRSSTMRRRRRSTRTTQGWWIFIGNDWARPWASVFARWALLSAWSRLWQWSVWGVYWGAGDFHWGLGTYLHLSLLSSQGHSWVGLDISSAMLGVANERELEGDLACGDLGEGLPFRFLEGFWAEVIRF